MKLFIGVIADLFEPAKARILSKATHDPTMKERRQAEVLMLLHRHDVDTFQARHSLRVATDLLLKK